MDRYLERLDYIESRSWIDQSRAARKRFLNMLVILSISLSILVLLIPTIDIIVEDPTTRWAAFVMIVVAMALLVLRQVAMAEPRGQSIPKKKKTAGSRGQLERLRESIDSASKGSSYAQMLSVLELRSAFRGKIKVMRGYSRRDLNSLIEDERSLHHVIKDKDLERLLTIDLKKTYMVRDGAHDGTGFLQMINRLTEKVEEWR